MEEENEKISPLMARRLQIEQSGMNEANLIRTKPLNEISSSQVAIEENVVVNTKNISTKKIKEKAKQKIVDTDKRTTFFFDLETQLLLTCLCQKLGVNKSMLVSRMIKELAKRENISITIQT